MTARTKNLLGLGAFVVAAVAMVWFVRGTGRRSADVIDALPGDSFLVATLDVDRLSRSPLGEALRSGPGARLLSDAELVATCGFDPIDRMREAAVAVPVEDDTGEFGVAIRADVSKVELIECARKVVDARGGAAPPTIRESGSFTLVEPGGALARRYPTLAYREGGPFLVARGSWLGAMVDTVEGRRPSAQREGKHLSLRRALGVTAGGAPSSALVVTVVLPRAMRERIRKDMGDEVATQAGDANSPALMAGVLGVEAAGLALEPGDAKGTDATLRVELACADDGACATVARLIDKTRRQLSDDALVRVLGVGPLLDHLTVESKGAHLSASTHAPAQDVARWVSRALELRTGRLPGGPLPSATPRPASSSDEVIRPDAGLGSAEGGRPAAP